MQNTLKTIIFRNFSQKTNVSFWSKIKNRIYKENENKAYFLSQKQKENETAFMKMLKEKYKLKSFIQKNEKEQFLQQITQPFLSVQNNFMSLNITIEESDWLFESFLTSENVKQSQDLQISLLWILLKKYKTKSVNDYFPILVNLLQDQDLIWSQINRILQILIQHKDILQKSDETQIYLKILLTELEKKILIKIQNNSQEINEAVVSIQQFKKLNYGDEQLFILLEKLLLDNIEPFNSLKNLIILRYFNDIENSLNAIKIKSNIFDKTAKLITKNMRHCYFNELYEYLVLFVQFQKQYGQKFTEVYDSFVKRVFIIKDLSLDINTQKLTNLLYLLKNKITSQQYRALLEKIQHVLFHTLDKLKANDYADFLYICFQENFIEEDYMKEFRNQALRYIYQYDLEQLLKVAWTNKSLLKSDQIQKKTLEILELVLQKQLKKKEKILQPKFLFPFVYIYSVELPKKIIDLYDQFIVQYYESFDLQDVSIILWSIVKKINIKKKILSILLLRTVNIIRPIQQKIVESQNQEEWEMEIITKVPFQDLMIVLKSLDYFDFKDDGILLSDMLFMFKNFIIFYIEEISKEDLFNILKLYFKQTQSFEQLLNQSKSFYDYLFLFIDRCKEIFTIQDFNFVIFLIVENKILTDAYAQQVQKLIQYKDGLIKINQDFS